MRILVVDLDGTHGANLATILAEHQLEIRSDVPVVLSDDLAIVAGPGAVDLCALLRSRDERLPILLLTEHGLVEQRVAGLRAGADDALEKPFAGSQMVARVSALERRAALIPRMPEVVQVDGCMFDLSRCLAVRDGKVTQLSAREAALIRWLHHNRGRTVERAEILERVFGVSPNVETRSVDVAVAALRKKIEREPERPSIIISVKGVGYAWGAR